MRFNSQNIVLRVHTHTHSMWWIRKTGSVIVRLVMACGLFVEIQGYIHWGWNNGHFQVDTNWQKRIGAITKFCDTRQEMLTISHNINTSVSNTKGKFTNSLQSIHVKCGFTSSSPNSKIYSEHLFQTIITLFLIIIVLTNYKSHVSQSMWDMGTPWRVLLTSDRGTLWVNKRHILLKWAWLLSVG